VTSSDIEGFHPRRAKLDVYPERERSQEVRWMYEAPIRFSSDSGSDCNGSRSSDGRFGIHRSLLRDREHLMRPYRLYLGLLAGFCVLLAFAGCGSITPIGELKATESTVSFGAVTVGQTSTATVTFMNGGASAVQITQASVTGQPFKLASAGSFPVTVAAGSAGNFPTGANRG
jgi:hypothetical protein